MGLRLNNLSVFKHQDKPLFNEISMAIPTGGVLSLMGPSGCGKSTLLDVIAGHLSDEFHYHGQVVINDQVMDKTPAHKRRVGILFQDDLLFPHLTVWQNLAFALPNDVRGNERRSRALNALQEIQLEFLADSYPEQISGGQRARVSLIRMLLAKPDVVLLDEPFSKLDSDLRSQFRDWVFDALKRANIATLLVTHDKQDVPEESQLLTWPWEGNYA
jgi:putative thiamine transport system ATP-binding protein